MKDSFIQYLQAECGFSQATVSAYKADLEKLSDFLDQRPIEDITHLQADAWIADCTEEGECSATIQRRLASLRCYLKFAGREDTRCLVVAPRGEKRLPYVMNQGETEKFIHAAETPLEKAVALVLYATGMRASELAGLRMRDLRQIDQGTLKVRGKGSKERLVPITKEAKAAIAAYLKSTPRESADGSVFLAPNGGPMHRVEVWRIIKAIGERAGFPETTPHTLRHCLASHMLANGADLMVIKEILGHSFVTTTQGYTKLDLAHLKRMHSKHPRP